MCLVGDEHKKNSSNRTIRSRVKHGLTIVDMYITQNLKIKTNRKLRKYNYISA